MILDNKCSPFERLKALRECIDRKRFARIMETHSGLSGIIAENVRVDPSFLRSRVGSHLSPSARKNSIVALKVLLSGSALQKL